MTGPSVTALVVVSRFNEAVTRRLLEGAVEVLDESGISEDRRDIVWVPGAFELPVTLEVLLSRRDYSFAVALGAVVRGETPHFDFVAGEATRGIGDVQLRHRVPIGYGLLTCDTLEQALARAGGAKGNKGREAAESALRTAEELRRVDGGVARQD